MLQVMIEAPIGHCRQQRRIAFRLEHLLHVNVIERLVPELGAIDGGDKLLFDGGLGRAGPPPDRRLLVHG